MKPTLDNISIMFKKISSTKKVKWTEDEDRNLKDLVEKYGPVNWALISQSMPNRTGKQCRERWLNHLRPDVVTTSWSSEEDNILIEKQIILGNSWVQIAKFLPGRSPDALKNRWSWLVRQKSDVIQEVVISKSQSNVCLNGSPSDSSGMSVNSSSPPTSNLPTINVQESGIPNQAEDISLFVSDTSNEPPIHQKDPNCFFNRPFK